MYFIIREKKASIFIHNIIFFEKYNKFWFLGFGISSWDIRNLLSLGLESSISRNIRNFFRLGSFYFLSLEIYFLKYKKFFTISVFWNIRIFRFLKYMEFFSVFPFSEIQEKLFFGNIRNFLMLRLESSIFQNVRNFFWDGFFYNFGLRLKSGPDSPILYYC